MSLKVLMIAFWQAAAVFGLCLLSKNRLYALLIGSAGAVVVAFIGADRYAGLDSLFVVVATLAVVWKLTPYGESRRAALFIGAKLLTVGGIAIAVIVMSMVFFSNDAARKPVNDAPLKSQSSEKSLDEWYRMGDDGEATFYVIPSSLRGAGDLIVMFVLLDFPSVRYREGAAYLSIKTDMAFDCTSGKAAGRSFSWHAAAMARGDVVATSESQSSWELVPVQSSVGMFLRDGCKAIKSMRYEKKLHLN